MRLAALDLGSNSFHVLVADAHPDGTLERVGSEKAVLRLGEVVAASGSIPPADEARAIDAAVRLVEVASAARAEVVAVATSAFRTATNGALVAGRISDATGVPVRIIGADEEASLTFDAVRASVEIEPGPALVLDIGGGSLEVGVGDRAGLRWTHSLELGASRLMGELVASDPPTASELESIERRARGWLEELRGDVAAFGPRMAIGSSGTITSAARAALALARGRSAKSVHQAIVTIDQLDDLATVVFENGLVERARLTGLDERRAATIPAGLAVLRTALSVFGFDRLTVSEWALREGVVLEAMGRFEDDSSYADPASVRLTSVRRLCERWDFDEAHASQVAKLGTMLFDQLRPLHGLGDADRDLLVHAALLHDIGSRVALDGHERHSAYLVEHGRLRGFSPVEVAILTCLCRFHGRDKPKSGFGAYANLDSIDQTRVMQLASLLRIADALDHSHSAPVASLFVEMREEEVIVRLQPAGDLTSERFDFDRKRDLFERCFRRRVTMAPAPFAASA